MLCYYGGGLSLLAYSDLTFLNNPDDSKSTSEYVLLLGGGAISCSSKKHECTVMLITKAEYVAWALVTMEAIWISRFLLDLGLVSIACAPIPLRTDSTTAVCLAKDL